MTSDNFTTPTLFEIASQRIALSEISRRVRLIGDVSSDLPFPHLLTYTLNPFGDLTATVAVRETFHIVGNKLAACPQQIPVRLVDELYPDTTLVRLPADTSPYKPKTDILFVDPLVHLPEHNCQHDITILAGPLHSTFQVRKGHSPGFPNLVPLSYFLAESRGGENPYARSFPKHFPRLIDANSTSFAGLAALSPLFPCRRRLAGTFDQTWKENQWPLLPLDFDYEFFNVAHPSLRCTPFLKGNEAIKIQGLGNEDFKFSLPQLSPIVLLMTGSNKSRHFATFNLDTVEIDINERTVALVWRTAFSPPDVEVSAFITETQMRN